MAGKPQAEAGKVFFWSTDCVVRLDARNFTS